jgi:hypothetical protein
MKYLKFTYVGAAQFPAVVGLQYFWARESAYPTQVPEFFGTCPDDSDTKVEGVLGIFIQTDWEQMRDDEMRNRIPQVVSMRQARLALLGAGLLGTVTDAVAAMTGDQGAAARIEWEFAVEVRRSQPLVVSLAATLALTGEQLDNLFVTAAAL